MEQLAVVLSRLIAFELEAEAVGPRTNISRGLEG